MKTWLLSISAVVMLTAVISIIAPEKRTGKFINAVFSLIVLLVIIQPVISLKDGNFSFEYVFEGPDTVMQEDYLYYVNKSKISFMENDCVKIIENYGIDNSTVDIEYTVDGNYNATVTKITVNLKNAVINLKDEHIDINEELSTALSSYLDIDIKAVYIDE